MEAAIARLAAIIFLAAPLFAQTTRLLPVDESERDPSLRRYLTALQQTVARKDAEALEKLLDREIRNNFGGDAPGIEGFRNLWKPGEPESPVWPLLDRLLKMGGAWQGNSFSIPYVFAKWPEDLDVFDYAAVTGSKVWLRNGAGVRFPGLRLLSYDIVKLHGQGETWWEIETLDGVRGYVSEQYVMSPVGYRAVFSKRGLWKMTALVAGD